MKEEEIREREYEEEVNTEDGASPRETKDDSESTTEENAEPATDEHALSPLSRFTRSEDAEQRPNVSLREILGGDILTAQWLRRQIGLIVMCVFFIIVYITNRYSSEQEIIDIKDLKTELQDMKYRTLTRSSELTVKMRQSHIEEQLKHYGDSLLRMSKIPPFAIKIKKEE